jgi:hypothetical protein
MMILILARPPFAPTNRSLSELLAADVMLPTLKEGYSPTPETVGEINRWLLLKSLGDPNVVSQEVLDELKTILFDFLP